MSLNLNSILRITGIVLLVIGASMVPSVFVSFIYDNSDIYLPFSYTTVITLIVGYILMKLFAHEEKPLKVRDGFFIVSLCWIVSCVVGAIPFIVTGSIPSFADAFFESCSGFSTTGATILGEWNPSPRE